jgi:hypothetical protein
MSRPQEAMETAQVTSTRNRVHALIKKCQKICHVSKGREVLVETLCLWPQPSSSGTQCPTLAWVPNIIVTVQTQRLSRVGHQERIAALTFCAAAGIVQCPLQVENFESKQTPREE